MRAASVAETKRARRQVERLAGEYVAGPRARAARKNDRIDPPLAIHFSLNTDERGVGRSAIGIVSAGHADFDVAETFFRKMGFESGQRFGGRHFRNEAG